MEQPEEKKEDALPADPQADPAAQAEPSGQAE